MNFFSHYFFDNVGKNPAYSFGLIAPDLLRNFTKNQYHKKGLTHPTILGEIEKGCLQHMERDKSFHQSKFFETTYNDLRSSFQSTCEKFGIPRFWFGLHVLIELWLDRILINRYPNTLIEFYEDLNSVQTELKEFLNRIDHNNPALFMSRYQQFCINQYLRKYTHNESIFYGLNQIYKSTGAHRTDWSEDQKSGLLNLVNEFDEAITKNLHLIR